MRHRIRQVIFQGLLVGALGAINSLAAMTPAELAARLARNEPILIVDVRSEIAYAKGHVPGAINIPLGLLPHKQLPTSQLVVICGDGLGVIDDQQALAVVRAKAGLRADVIDGGYAAWLAETRLTTAPPGAGPEKLPGITYNQLVAAGKGDMLLVDLRTTAAAPATAAMTAGPRRERQTAAGGAGPDVLAEFAAKIGVPVVSANGLVANAARSAPKASSAVDGAPARAAAPVSGLGSPNRLLVLVADTDAAANEAARQLRASGVYRFTILIGGTESIRHEGRVGTGRMDSPSRSLKP